MSFGIWHEVAPAPATKLTPQVLCKIFDFFKLKEKLLVQLVCKKWKTQIDKNVPFHVDLNDNNSDLIRQRFGTFGLVTSITIVNYSMPHIPIHNLASLKTIAVKENVHKLAVFELISKAISLHSLRLYVHHIKESVAIEQIILFAYAYPALQNIKDLYIGYESSNSSPIFAIDKAWNEILYAEMKNVHRLVVDHYLCVPPVRGFDFFRLAARMPKLHDFTYRIWSRFNQRQPQWYYQVPRDLQPLTLPISEKLANLTLTRLTAIIVKNDEPIWAMILAKQTQLQKLNLCNKYNSIEGFPISMFRPVLRNSKQSLRSISLQIDASKSGIIDMEMFAGLPSLQKLVIHAWPIPHRGYYNSNLLFQALNCSSVVSGKLQKLIFSGFKFYEADIINLIKNISNEDLGMVAICHEYAFIWKNFERREEEMGIVRMIPENKSAYFSYFLSRGPSAMVSSHHNYEFVGLSNGDESMGSKYVTVKSQCVELLSRR
ncbi:unnamed protein product [Orchesella dallaii]|uniref:F-box domain-containing protein n=1 Tax=Orchesella dallaii TaxID=48710 RepID=A0ABP1QNX7_9HEXA